MAKRTAQAQAVSAKLLEHGFTLSNGLKLPALGFGTWQAESGEICANAVQCALEHGYDLVDGAAIYANEESVGLGYQRAGLKREEYFVTSKVWNTCRGYQSTLDACLKTLKDLNLEYLDLYLIHWPANAKQFNNWDEINRKTWEALIKLYEDGYVKAIGVSNFKEHHLKTLMEYDIQPMVNQIEFHPGFIQKDLVNYCQKHNILVEAWSPFGCGRILQHPKLVSMAEQKGVTVAQICLRYALQHQVLALPKSVHSERIIQNLDIFSFSLNQEEMAILDALDQDKIGFSNLDPDTIDF